MRESLRIIYRSIKAMYITMYVSVCTLLYSMYRHTVIMLCATFSCLWSADRRSSVQSGGGVFILEPESHLENGTETNTVHIHIERYQN